MKKSKISLSRNRANKNLNYFLSSSGKEENKTIFKTTQEEQRTIPSIANSYKRGLKKKDINIIFSVKNYDKYIKTKYNSDFSTKFLLVDDSDSKMTSPISNTIRYNHSIQRFKHNNYTIKKYKGSMSYSGYNLIKLNKPYLLKLLNKEAINRTLNPKIISGNINTLNIDNNNISSTYSKAINNFKLKKNKIYDYNNSKNNENIKLNRILMQKVDTIYNLKELHEFQKLYNNNNKIKSETQRNLAKTFKKLSNFNINFPLDFDRSKAYDNLELRDKVNLDYYNDEEIKKKLRKTLYFEINSFDFDNGIYWEYKKSIPNYINFIYDINILPHLKNKFLYNKPITKQTQINEIIFNKNAISKDVAKAINRYIINNIRKVILEKEEAERREKKLRELAKSNKIMLKLYLEKKDEDLPELTSAEAVELSDYFGKIIDYKFVRISSGKLRKIVYEGNSFFKKNQ